MRSAALTLALLCLLAAPAAAQSLLLEEGETRPFLGTAWFTDGEFDGWAGQVGLAMKGKADLALQFDRSTQSHDRTIRTWTPGLRLNAVRPTAENPVALVLEFNLTFGRLTHDVPLGGDGAEVKGAGAAARFVAVPTGWAQKGYFWISVGVQSLSVGSGVGEIYPLGVGLTRRVAGKLLADLQLVTAEGHHTYLVGGTWLF